MRKRKKKKKKRRGGSSGGTNCARVTTDYMSRDRRRLRRGSALQPSHTRTDGRSTPGRRLRSPLSFGGPPSRLASGRLASGQLQPDVVDRGRARGAATAAKRSTIAARPAGDSTSSRARPAPSAQRRTTAEPQSASRR